MRTHTEITNESSFTQPKVSGASTDSALFSKHGAQLVHHYRAFSDCVAHASLWGSFMIDLLYFTNRACADAIWEAKRSRNSGTGSRSLPDLPVPLPQNVMQRTSDVDPPVRKAESPVVADELSPSDTSAVVSAEEYSALQVPIMRSASFGWRPPILPVSLPFPRFATHPVAPDIGRNSEVSVIARLPVVDPIFGFSCIGIRVFGVGFNGLPGACG